MVNNSPSETKILLLGKQSTIVHSKAHFISNHLLYHGFTGCFGKMLLLSESQYLVFPLGVDPVGAVLNIMPPLLAPRLAMGGLKRLSAWFTPPCKRNDFTC